MDTLHRSEHLIAFALASPWALEPSMLAIVANILARRIAGEATDREAIAAALVARSTRTVPAPNGRAPSGGTVAVIPIHGVIAPRMNLLSDMSGGTTFEQLTSELRRASADPNVRTIVFDVDSPGGNVAGASEFAREVRAAAAQKTVIAHANHLCASAAYWAMAGASEIVASPSALVGSIGVFSIRDDISAALEKLGIKREVFAAGKYKAEGVDGGPLSADARAHLHALVGSAFGRFVGDVARGRKVPVQTVRDGYGQGRLLDTEMAQRAGLIDKILTLDEVLLTLDGTAGRAALDPHRQALARAALAARRHDLAAVARRHGLQ